MDAEAKDVGHPPSGVQASHNLAQPVKAEYRRHLPHLQVEDKPHFVTFNTYQRVILPETLRQVVIRHCLHEHGRKPRMHGIVVMPDHVYEIFTPLKGALGNPYGLAEIMNGIKGASAHSINRALQRRGPVWQKESFDHVLRSDEKIWEKLEYLCQNPLRKSLVSSMDDYPWLWREWAEGNEPTDQERIGKRPPSAAAGQSPG